VAFKDGAKKVNLSLRAIWPAKSWEVSPWTLQCWN
jgi:hypothetical protein